MKKVRNSNMELLRVVAMLFVLLVHCGYAVYGFPRLNKVVADLPLWITRITLQHITICCVNIFVLLSGWFGIRPTLKGALNLLFQIFFIGSVMLLGVKLFVDDFPNSFELIFKSFTSYWFVWSYFFIYLISPLLNNFVEQTTITTQVFVIFSFLFFQVIDGLLFEFSNNFNSGYSPTSFIFLYLIARCINYQSFSFLQKSSLYYFRIYVFCVIFPVLLILISALLDFYQLFNFLTGYLIAYNNPIVILESLALLLLFNKMNFKSKIVNWLGAGSFAAYLTHQNIQVRSFFKSAVSYLYDSFNSFSSLALMFLYVIIVFLLSVLLDKFRSYIWKMCIEHLVYEFEVMFSRKISMFVKKLSSRSVM